MKETLTLKEADMKVKSWLKVGLYSKYLWGFSLLAGFSLGSCDKQCDIITIIHILDWKAKCDGVFIWSPEGDNIP